MTDKKQSKQPWKPTLDQLLDSTEMAGKIPTIPQNDPRLEQVMESMMKLGGSKHRTAREKRVYHRHLSPKAKAKKKVQRRQRRNARRAHPSNRGKAKGGWK